MSESAKRIICDLEELHTTFRTVKGWKVAFTVWQSQKPAEEGGTAYLAIVATGYEESGRNLAAMDCDFVFFDGEKREEVVQSIERSMDDENVWEKVVAQAEVGLMRLQKQAQGGTILPN